jgi:hypothetical protein
MHFVPLNTRFANNWSSGHNQKGFARSNSTARESSLEGPLPVRGAADDPKKEKRMPRVSLDQLAPDFSLPDFAGNMVSLSDFRGKKNVLLVFNRGFF